MSWLGLAGLVWDPSATAAAPKWAAILISALFMSGGIRRRLPPAALAFAGLCCWMIWRSPDFLGWLAALAVMLAALTFPPEKLPTGPTAALLGGGSSLMALLSVPCGGQGNPDWLGLVVAVSLPCTIEWARGDRRRWLVIALEVAGLVVARSRTAWLASAISLLWVSRWLALPLIAAVGVALTQPALQGRLWIWRHSALIALRHPLLGAGEFSAAFAAVQGESLRKLQLTEACRLFVYTPSAHNDYLQLAAEAGLPALLLLLATLVLVRRPAVAAIAVAALGDRPLAQPPVLMLLALMVAACPSPPGGVAVRARTWLCAAGLMLALPSWLAAHLATRARDQDPLAAAQTLALAESLDPRSGPIAFEVGLAAAQRHDLDAAIVHFEIARRRYFQPATEVALGNAYLEKGDISRAVDTYTQLLRLQPGSLRGRLNLAEALRRLGRDKEADREWQTAHALWPAHVRERD